MGEPIPDIIQIYNSIYYNITIYNSNNCITVYTTVSTNLAISPNSKMDLLKKGNLYQIYYRYKERYNSIYNSNNCITVYTIVSTNLAISSNSKMDLLK